MRINNEPSTIAITLAGGDIAITEGGNLVIGPREGDKTGPRYDLVPATRNNFENIISYLERLKIHSTDS